MAWLPEQTGCALEEIAADMRALIAKASRIERNAGPDALAMLRAGDAWINMPLHDFADDSDRIAKAIFAEVHAKTPEVA